MCKRKEELQSAQYVVKLIILSLHSTSVLHTVSMAHVSKLTTIKNVDYRNIGCGVHVNYSHSHGINIYVFKMCVRIYRVIQEESALPWDMIV